MWTVYISTELHRPRSMDVIPCQSSHVAELKFFYRAMLTCGVCVEVGVCLSCEDLSDGVWVGVLVAKEKVTVLES